MIPLRTALSFPVTSAPDDLEPGLAVFHRFIQRGLVEGQLLDVADYRHVPDGPDLMLIAHDIDYGISATAFTVVRKRAITDDVVTQTRDLIRMAYGALDAIATDGELPVEVDRSTFDVAVLDRRLGDRDTVSKSLMDVIEPAITDLFGADASVVIPDGDPRQPAQVHVTADAATAADALVKLGGAQPPHQSPYDITVADLVSLKAAGEPFVLLDVREQSEYDTVNLDGTLIPLPQLGERMGELDEDAHIVVHCRAGMRGAKAVIQLREAGFANAWNVNGGLMAWIDTVDPTLPRY